MPLEVACPANCATATVAAALAAAGPLADRTVGILGAGMLGLSACTMAQLRGAAAVIAVEPNAARREQALRFGATHAIAPEELPSKAAQVSGGPGLDVILELSGAATAFDTAWPALCIGGTLVLVGAVYPGPAVSVSMEQIVRRNLTIRGVHNYAPKDLLAAVEFLTAAQGQFPLQELVGPWYPLAEVAAALETARDPRHLRVGIRG
jgi:alcohol dehydrogenase